MMAPPSLKSIAKMTCVNILLFEHKAVSDLSENKTSETISILLNKNTDTPDEDLANEYKPSECLANQNEGSKTSTNQCIASRAVTDQSESPCRLVPEKWGDYVTQLLETDCFTAVSQMILDWIVEYTPTSLTNRLLLALVPPYSREINLSSCERVTLSGLLDVFKKCVHLKTLQLNQCPQLMAADVFNYMGLAELPVTTLILESVPNVTDDIVHTIIRALRSLVTLNLSSCQGITDDVFLVDPRQQLLRETSKQSLTPDLCCYDYSLSCVDISACGRLTSVAIRHLASLCGPHLKHVNFSWTQIDSTALLYLAGYNFPTIIDLVLDDDHDLTSERSLKEYIEELRHIKAVYQTDTDTGEPTLQVASEDNDHPATGNNSYLAKGNNNCLATGNNSYLATSSMENITCLEDVSLSVDTLEAISSGIRSEVEDLLAARTEKYNTMLAEDIDKKIDKHPCDLDQSLGDQGDDVDENPNGDSTDSSITAPITLMTNTTLATDIEQLQEIDKHLDNFDDGRNKSQTKGSLAEDIADIQGMITSMTTAVREIQLGLETGIGQSSKNSLNPNLTSNTVTNTKEEINNQDTLGSATLNSLSSEEVSQNEGVVVSNLNEVTQYSDNDDEDNSITSMMKELSVNETDPIIAAENCEDVMNSNGAIATNNSSLKTQPEVVKCIDDSSILNLDMLVDLNKHKSETKQIDINCAMYNTDSEHSTNCKIQSELSEGTTEMNDAKVRLDTKTEIVPEICDKSEEVEQLNQEGNTLAYSEKVITKPKSSDIPKLDSATVVHASEMQPDTKEAVTKPKSAIKPKYSDISKLDSSTVINASKMQPDTIDPLTRPESATKQQEADKRVIKLFESQLVSLHMSSIRFINEKLGRLCVEQFFQANTTLQSLHISWKGLSEMILKKIISSLHDLRDIDVEECTWLQSGGVATLGRACVNLTDINLRGVVFIKDMGMMSILSLKHLTKLNLAESEITDTTLHRLAKRLSPTLTELDLSWCEEITEKGISYICSTCDKLEKLTLRNLPVSHQCLELLADTSPGITSLLVESVTRSDMAQDNTIIGVDSPITSICRMSQLTVLDISWNLHFQNESVGEILSYCSQLKTAHMKGLKQITTQPFLPIISALDKFGQLVTSNTSAGKHDLRKRSSVYAPCLYDLDLEYSDSLDDVLLMDIVNVCAGTLQVVDYYGQKLEPEI